MKRKKIETLSKRELDLILKEEVANRYCIINHKGNIRFIAKYCGSGGLAHRLNGYMAKYVVLDFDTWDSGLYSDEDMETYLKEAVYREDVKMIDQCDIEMALFHPPNETAKRVENIDMDPEIKKERINKKMQEILENSDV